MSVTLELVLPQGVYKKLEEEAKKRGLSVSDLLMRLIAMLVRGEIE